MSGTKELEIDVEIPEDDLHGGALDVLKVLRPEWKQEDVKFLVSTTLCSRWPHPFSVPQISFHSFPSHSLQQRLINWQRIPIECKFGYKYICISSSVTAPTLIGFTHPRGSTWREWVTRTRITLIFDNFPQSSTFCEIFTSKFHSVYADCRRLCKIVKDSAHFWQIVEDYMSDCQRLPLSHSRSHNSFSSFNPPHPSTQQIIQYSVINPEV